MSPSHLLRKAHKLERLGDKESAVELYNSVIVQFPGTQEAETARSDLAELGRTPPIPAQELATNQGVDSSTSTSNDTFSGYTTIFGLLGAGIGAMASFNQGVGGAEAALAGGRAGVLGGAIGAIVGVIIGLIARRKTGGNTGTDHV